MKNFKRIDGGVTAALGFRACGVEAGIKYAGRKDLAMLAADKPAVAAALYTSNQVAAAPVQIDRERTATGRAQAIVMNSGCANACTGPKGLAAAKETARLAARALGIDEKLVLVCSTGVIGMPMPMDRVAAGIAKAVPALRREGADDAAHAIMTTDKVDKQVAVELKVGGKVVHVGGMCKGSGMIEPHLATMLGFLTTDAAITAASLKAALKVAIGQSFNKIVVDGDMSTNDTVIALASGAAGNAPLTGKSRDFPAFRDALTMVATELCKKMVVDAEGASKFVTVTVKGAASEEDARKAARAIAKSPLAKTSWFGRDPNWGRVIAAAGYSGAAVDDQKARIYYGDVCAYNRGKVAGERELKAMKAIMEKRAFDVTVDLGLGKGEDVIYTCDFSYDYVKINAEYTT